ncbi:hypothetical protein FKP32DRAFT_1600321 [Trametes sanguinea]|nr:hypothetical protein FKP32DRAFT_1600321 [Trametes sanguinea]
MSKPFDPTDIQKAAEALLGVDQFDTERLGSGEWSECESDGDSDDFPEISVPKPRKHARGHQSSDDESDFSEEDSRRTVSQEYRHAPDRITGGETLRKAEGKRKFENEKEFNQLVDQMQNLSLDDPKYGFLYLKVCAMKPMAAECLPKPKVNNAAAPVKGVIRDVPPHMASNSYDRNMQSCPQRMDNHGCYGCGDSSHIMNNCPTIEEYLRKGYIARNNSGRIVQPDGSPLRRQFNENWVQAAKRIMPTVNFVSYEGQRLRPLRKRETRSCRKQVFDGVKAPQLDKEKQREENTAQRTTGAPSRYPMQRLTPVETQQLTFNPDNDAEMIDDRAQPTQTQSAVIPQAQTTSNRSRMPVRRYSAIVQQWTPDNAKIPTVEEVDEDEYADLPDLQDVDSDDDDDEMDSGDDQAYATCGETEATEETPGSDTEDDNDEDSDGSSEDYHLDHVLGLLSYRNADEVPDHAERQTYHRVWQQLQDDVPDIPAVRAGPCTIMTAIFTQLEDDTLHTDTISMISVTDLGATKSNSGLLVPGTPAPPPLIKVPLRVNGYTIPFLLDTGAQLNCIRADVWKKVRGAGGMLNARPARTILASSTGELMKCIGVWSTEVEFGNLIMKVDFMIIDSMTSVGILGCPWQKQRHMWMEETPEGVYMGISTWDRSRSYGMLISSPHDQNVICTEPLVAAHTRATDQPQLSGISFDHAEKLELRRQWKMHVTGDEECYLLQNVQSHDTSINLSEPLTQEHPKHPQPTMQDLEESMEEIADEAARTEAGRSTHPQPLPRRRNSISHVESRTRWTGYTVADDIEGDAQPENFGPLARFFTDSRSEVGQAY